MATYNFKNDTKVYLIHNSVRYKLDVTEEISFSQTFTDQTYPKRTLHNLNHFFEESNIKKANPANFEFTIPIILEDDLQIVHDLLIDNDTVGGHSLKTFDLWIESTDVVYVLKDCVITNGTYIIEKLENLKLGIQGQARLLRRELFVPGTGEGYSINPQSSTKTFQKVDHLTLTINGTDKTDSLYRVSVEVQNDIKWTPYETIDDALDVSQASNTMYPSNFTLEKRIVSGSISRYVTDVNEFDTQIWRSDRAIRIRAGHSSLKGFDINLDSCTFTNRVTVEDVYSQTYDWKFNSNSGDLSNNSAAPYISLNNN